MKKCHYHSIHDIFSLNQPPAILITEVQPYSLLYNYVKRLLTKAVVCSRSKHSVKHTVPCFDVNPGG